MPSLRRRKPRRWQYDGTLPRQPRNDAVMQHRRSPYYRHSPERTVYGRCPQNRIRRVRDADQGRLGGVHERRAAAGRGHEQAAGPKPRPGRPGRECRKVHRQARRGARLPGSGRFAGRAAHRHRLGHADPGFRQVGRHRHGQDLAARRRGRHPARPPHRSDETGSGGRFRPRPRPARLCFRTLQDQAQGGRGEAGQAAA